MVKRTAALLLVIGLAPCVPVCAGNGTDAVPFMKVDTGARAAGLGGAFAAMADDASAVFHNPAGLTRVEKKELMLSHVEWLERIHNECVSYVHAAGTDWTVGGGASMLFSGLMTKYDRNGLESGNFYENEGFLSLAAARGLGGDFSGGLAVKTIYQKADKERGGAYAADAGLLYHGNEWRFALGMENAGSKLKLYRKKFALPAGYKAAAAWRALDPVWVTVQLVQRPIGGFSTSVGAEYGLAITDAHTAYARAGYLAGPGSDAGSGIALGLGIGTPGLKLDYAFTPFGDLGNVHRLSFSVKFGEARETLRDREGSGSPYKRSGNKSKARQMEPKKEQPAKKSTSTDKKKYNYNW